MYAVVCAVCNRYVALGNGNYMRVHYARSPRFRPVYYCPGSLTDEWIKP